MNAAAVSMFDKPAVAAPKRALTAGQRKALQAVGQFRHHRQTFSGGWYIGNRYCQRGTVSALMKEGLVRRAKNPGRGKGYRLELTMAGQIVLERLGS
ncbi:hypothetical protein [Martelella mangrovi]|uniref:MarR family transcriptional regulator n=1 Tax=Martelella mangrovi TaxID=1397477 RepID=A0ABV2IDM1_9HYPH